MKGFHRIGAVEPGANISGIGVAKHIFMHMNAKAALQKIRMMMKVVCEPMEIAALHVRIVFDLAPFAADAGMAGAVAGTFRFKFVVDPL